METGAQLVSSCTQTYWLTYETMVLFIENILVPYFDKQKQILSCPPTQMALWQIDVWLVH